MVSAGSQLRAAAMVLRSSAARGLISSARAVCLGAAARGGRLVPAMSSMSGARHRDALETLAKSLQFDDAVNIQFTSAGSGLRKISAQPAVARERFGVDGCSGNSLLGARLGQQHPGFSGSCAALLLVDVFGPSCVVVAACTGGTLASMG